MRHPRAVAPLFPAAGVVAVDEKRAAHDQLRIGGVQHFVIVVFELHGVHESSAKTRQNRVSLASDSILTILTAPCSTTHRNMKDIADRQLSVRTTCSIEGA